MKLVVDARILSLEHHTGLSRYCAEITKELAKLHPITVVIHDDRQRKFLPEGIDVIKVPRPGLETQRAVTKLMDKIGADVVYSPTQYFTLGKHNFRVIMSLHDAIGFQVKRPYSADIPAADKFLWRLFHASKKPQRAILNQADLVVTVSQTARLDIIEHLAPKTPIIVVSPAPNRDHTHAHRHEISATSKQLVYVGSFFRYKHPEILVDALAMLPTYKLLFASKVGASVQKQLMKRATDSAQLTFFNGFNDEEYSTLLQDSFALVSASTHEGFGLTPLEAQLAGTPVIVADIPVSREVYGDSALYFTPNDPGALAECVQRLQNDPALRQTLIERGYKNAARFSWEKSAKELYREIVKLQKS